MKRIIAMSGVSQDAYGRWFWWTIDDVGFYEKVAVASAWRHPVNPWRFAWTRAKHLRRAADALMRAGYGAGWVVSATSHVQWPRGLRWLGRIVGHKVTHAVVGAWGPGRPDPRYAAWARAYERAAERADWGTRP